VHGLRRTERYLQLRGGAVRADMAEGCHRRPVPGQGNPGLHVTGMLSPYPENEPVRNEAMGPRLFLVRFVLETRPLIFLFYIFKRVDDSKAVRCKASCF
jgi:hypothetical protein